MWLDLLSSPGELADGGQPVREVRRMLKLHSGVNLWSWEGREDKQSCGDAVLGVCCTRWQFMIMPRRDRQGWLNLVFCDDGWVVDEKERDAGWRWEWCGGHEQIQESRGRTCLIGLVILWIGVITRRIRTCTCRIGDGKLTCTPNSLQSQFLIMISPMSSDLCLSRPQLYHYLRTRSNVIPLNAMINS